MPADIYVRYLRLKKEDVLFIGGSDEHGVPITIRAKKEGITPQDVVDRYHSLIKESFKEFGISFDVYSRTTVLFSHHTVLFLSLNIENLSISLFCPFPNPPDRCHPASYGSYSDSTLFPSLHVRRT